MVKFNPAKLSFLFEVQLKIVCSLLILPVLFWPPLALAKSYNVNNFRPIPSCSFAQEANLTRGNPKYKGPYLFEENHNWDLEIVCKRKTWRSKECKVGIWVDEQKAALKPGQYIHDISENELQFTNQQNWEIKSIFIEYSYERGDSIIYELSIEGLNIQPNERALLTSMPQKSYYIRSLTLFGSPKQECSTPFTDDEIAERERAQSEKEKLAAEKTQQAASVKKQKSTDTEAVPTTKIYTNCIADKLPPNASEDFTIAVKSICLRASQSPTFWNKLLYDYLGQ